MSDITVTADSVAIVYPILAETFPVKVVEAVTRGLAGYQIAATGKYGIADANAAGKQQFRGLFLDAGAAGQGGISLLKKGFVAGFDLSAMSYDDPVYLSDNVGAFATTAGTMSVICGRVFGMSDDARTKVLYIDADWLRAWS